MTEKKKQKKITKQQTAPTKQNTDNTIAESVRKSQLAASNEFDFKKISRKQQGLLDCAVEEKKEELVITYGVQNKTLWTSIRKENRELLIAALADAGKLKQAAEHYRFSLEPQNLYYDIQGRVYVKSRDVYSPGEGYCEENFLRQYKSLIGCTMIKKYKFEDYLNGGDDLLKEDKFLSTIAECTETEQIMDRLQEEYQRYRKDHRRRFVEVARKKNTVQKIALSAACAAAAVSLAGAGYLAVWERPYQQAVMAANEAYLQSDYASTVEALDEVSVNRMNVYQKYILAVSCVKCESFSDANQRNILNTISLNGDEKVMEYWIYINRLNTEAAADIAMQESSDQLLYYAYLKEKAVIENDTSLSGQEKSDRLSEIENKLQPLADEYSALTGE